MSARHNPRVVRELGEDGVAYRCRCACGMRGPAHRRHREAAVSTAA